MEGIKGAKTPYMLHSFHDPESIQDCKLISDAEIGGFSQSNLTWTPLRPSEHQPRPADDSQPPSRKLKGYARFHGHISTELPKHRPEIQRSGYAAWRTADRGPTIFGRSLWDIDPYAYLALRIKSDGRAYFVNLQTESVVPTDLHQHRLFAKRPGEWETVVIRWNDFVRTNHGFVVEPQTEMLRQKVRSVGIGLTDRVPGPFELCIERIWATNSPDEASGGTAHGAAAEGKLRNRDGDHVSWGQRSRK
jgi:NADH dehydrogenase [ubiquinone] 1 alpha subcomplex assembly factor 1